MIGEHPTFSPEEKNEIRRALGFEWNQAHFEKNSVADRSVRDQLTERMILLESLMDKVMNL